MSLRRGRIRIGVVAALLATVAFGGSARAALPDGRVFERVSQADTNGTTALQHAGGFVAPIDGDTVLFGEGPTPTAPSQSGVNPVFVAHRAATGWDVSSLLPTSIGPTDGYTLIDALPDLSASVWSVNTTFQFSAPPPTLKQNQVLRYRDAGGGFETIVADPTDESEAGFADQSGYGGISADGLSVIYSSDVSPAGLPDSEGLRKVYRWHPGGGVERLAVGAGSPLAECNTEAAGLTDFNGLIVSFARSTNNVSLDGGTVFLQGGETPQSATCPAQTQAYVDREGATTLISRPTDGTVAPAQPAAAYFDGATPDGQVAYFETASILSADDQGSGIDLYRWSAAAEGLPEEVACLTCGPAAHGVQRGEIVVSSTGSHVYFKASGVIGGEGEPGVTSLFVYDGASVRQVVALGSGSPLLPSQARMTRDGTVIVFPGGGGSIDGNPLFRADVGDGSITVGPLAPGALGGPAIGYVEALQGQARTRALDPAGAVGIAGSTRGTISEDGRTTVFVSREALAPGAIDGEFNIYRRRDGETALVSPRGGSLGVSISADGNDIFLVSPEPLTADTVQVTQTLYDARVGGGFPAPPVPPATCQGEACRGSAPAPPRGPTPRSTVATGNPTFPTLRLIRPGRSQREAFAHRGTIALRLTATGPGRIVARALSRLSGKRETVARAGRPVAAAPSAVTLRLRLDRAATARLRRRGRLPVTIVATLPGAQTQRISFSLTSKRRGS